MQTEAKRDEVPLPEPIGEVAQCPGHPWFAAKYLRMEWPAPLAGTKLYTADQLREHGRQCVQAERERCAQVVERMADDAGNGQDIDDNFSIFKAGPHYAAAIRSQNLVKE